MFLLISVLAALFTPSICHGCGKRPFHSARVVNGQNAAPHSWPWQISLRKDGMHICGGSLIRPNWVVTAAHCVYKNKYPGSYRVVVGAHKRLGFTSIEKAFRVKAIHMHEDFTMETLKHDIAVLELRGSATISDEVSTVCLPSEETKPGTECFVTGWGLVSESEQANILQQGQMPIVSNKDCAKKYTRFESKAHLCAGKGQESSSAGCHGDSGGPLVCEQGDSWYLHGAVSFGKKGCLPTAYTVFARITSYIPWIMDKIGGSPPLPATPPPPATPPKPSPPKPGPGCRDNQTYCPSYKHYCIKYPSFRKDCRKTCSAC